MKAYILAAILLSGTSCEAKQPEWGEKSFIIENISKWSSETVARSCLMENARAIFLFQSSDEYFLITRHQGVFDIAFINTKVDPIEIEANGGLGRYIEIQKQFDTLRRFPGNTVGQSEYATYVSATPKAPCNF